MRKLYQTRPQAPQMLSPSPSTKRRGKTTPGVDERTVRLIQKVSSFLSRNSTQSKSSGTYDRFPLLYR